MSLTAHSDSVEDFFWLSQDVVGERLYLWNDMAEVGIDESPREFPSHTVRPAQPSSDSETP